MVNVSFTENLARHVSVSTLTLADGALTDIFSQLFQIYPSLKPYLFDEQNQLRQHIMIALDTQLLQGNIDAALSRSDFQRVHIMQALSGG